MTDIREFLENEILTWSIVAGLGRGYSVYKKNIGEKERRDMKLFLRKELRERFTDDYYFNDEVHIKNINRLKLDIETQFSQILNHEKISFGRVQKLINLYLKYRWVCFGGKMPIHCPIDAVVLTKLHIELPWTKMGESDYRNAIDKIKIIAATKQIAKWELNEFNKNNRTYSVER